MKIRRLIVRLVLAVGIIYLLATNIFLIKPFKDYKPEDLQEVSLGQISISSIKTYTDEVTIKDTINALKRLRLTGEVPEPVIGDLVHYITLTLKNGEVVNIMESKPYLFIDGIWYRGEVNTFNSIDRLYERYFYNVS